MTARVEPPAEHRGVRWHWLEHPRHGVMLAAWVHEEWSLVFLREWVSATNGTPAERAAMRGYRYLGPAIPPETSDAG